MPAVSIRDSGCCSLWQRQCLPHFVSAGRRIEVDQAIFQVVDKIFQDNFLIVFIRVNFQL